MNKQLNSFAGGDIMYFTQLIKVIVGFLIISFIGGCQTTSSTVDPKTGIVKNYGYPDIEYKLHSNVKNIGVLENGIFVPKNHNGAAVVFLPSCSGIRSFNSSDVRDWAQFILGNGYAVAVIQYGTPPRPDKRPYNCGQNKSLSDMRLVKDVYDATLALSNVVGVDKNRIFTIGTSLGAQIGVDSIKASIAELALKNQWGPTPRAVVSLYGGCAYPSRTYLTSSVVSPVLWMMGKDDNYYMKGCSSSTFTSIKKIHPQSEFINFANAGHCWDCKALNGFVNKREKQTYIYNADVTKKSRDSTLRFLEQFK
jgi:dienelactone hydrolase